MDEKEGTVKEGDFLEKFLKTKYRYYHTLLRRAASTTVKTANADAGVEPQELSNHCRGEQSGAATWEHRRALSYKAVHMLTVCSSNCTPWYVPKEVLSKTYVHTKPCTQVFTVGLLIITLGATRCPSVGDG